MTAKIRTAASISHEEVVIELLANDPAFTVEYLSSLLEDGTTAELLLGLRRVTQAHGGVAKVALKAKLNPTTLYRTLSAKGNPELRSLSALLGAMGMRLAVRQIGGKSVRRRGKNATATRA